jgi:hypothetical protein
MAQGPSGGWQQPPWVYWPPPPRQATPTLLIAMILLGLLGPLVIGSALLLVPSNPGSETNPVTFMSRWKTQAIVLTAVRPAATMRVTLGYSGSFDRDDPPAVVVLAPRADSSAASSGPTLDPQYVLVEPIVRAEVIDGSAGGGSCAGPCELTLDPPACRTWCESVFVIRIWLEDPAGRGSVEVGIEAGITANWDSSFPSDLSVEMQLEGSASSTGGGA